MMQPQIKITIAKGEPLKYEVINVQGSGCKQLTASLNKLGEATITLKPEFYEEPSIVLSADVSVGGGW